jgi:C-terminal processing protease CtpA/Prc
VLRRRAEPLEKRECVKSLCDDCGFKKAVEVECKRTGAGVGVKVDGDMYVTSVVAGSAAAKAKVRVGWRVIAVRRLEDGDSLMEPVSCKTGLEKATGKAGGPANAKARVRFQPDS